MQRNVFDLYLQCQKKQNDMKTKEKEMLEEICFMARAMVMTEELSKTNLKSERDYKEDILCWANRIKELTEKFNDK